VLFSLLEKPKMTYHIKFIPVLSVLVLQSLLGFTQTRTDSLAIDVNRLQGERLVNLGTEHRDSIFNLFDSTIAHLMAKDDFHSQPIDSSLYYFYNCSRISDDTNVTLVYMFINCITYCNSNDGQLRVYSWEYLSGGCGHMYRNYLTYKNGEGTISSLMLDTLIANTEDDWAYVGYYDIKTYQFGNRSVYFLYGFGTSCGNSAYKSLRFFELLEGKLVECFDCYPNGKSLVNFGSRRNYLSFNVNTKNKTITYKKPLYNYEYDYIESDKYEKKVLKFKKGKFVEQE